MTKIHSLLLLGLFSLSSCNLWGGIDKPSGDEQLLVAARACLDRGDYACATEYYQKLSNSLSDVKTSELAFVNLAQNGIFSMQDFVASLGSSRGSGTTFLRMAERIAARGKTASTDREAIQAYYASLSTISDSRLRAYMQFIVALAMFEDVLATAVGADGVLTSTDIASSDSCRTIAQGACSTAPCNAGFANTGTEPTAMSSSTNWTTAPSVKKLEIAASDASTALSNAGISSSVGGTVQLMTSISSQLVGAASDNCRRWFIINLLFNSN